MAQCAFTGVAASARCTSDDYIMGLFRTVVKIQIQASLLTGICMSTDRPKHCDNQTLLSSYLYSTSPLQSPLIPHPFPRCEVDS